MKSDPKLTVCAPVFGSDRSEICFRSKTVSKEISTDREKTSPKPVQNQSVLKSDQSLLPVCQRTRMRFDAPCTNPSHREKARVMGDYSYSTGVSVAGQSDAAPPRRLTIERCHSLLGIAGETRDEKTSLRTPAKPTGNWREDGGGPAGPNNRNAAYAINSARSADTKTTASCAACWKPPGAKARRCTSSSTISLSKSPPKPKPPAIGIHRTRKPSHQKTHAVPSRRDYPLNCYNLLIYACKLVGVSAGGPNVAPNPVPPELGRWADSHG